MKLITCIALALISFLPCNAQNLSVEELKEKLSRHTQPDTIRINLLNQLARRNDISPSFRDSLINESLLLSHKINYMAGEALALSIKPQYADKSKAGDIARQSILLAEKSGDKNAMFWAYRSLGQAMLYTSESINSIEPFSKALRVAVAEGNPRLIISAQLAFVDYYKNVKVVYPVALVWALKALHTAEQYHNTIDLPIIYRNIGLVYLMIGEDEKSLTHLQKALAASRQTGDNETEQYVLNDIGERYRITGMYPEALQAYSEAALLIKDSFNIELNQSNVADTYQRMGNDSMCFVYGFRALAGAQQQNDTIGIAWIDNILSRAYLHSGKTDSALYYGLQGYQYALQTQTPEFKRDNSEALANAYTADKNFGKALYYYKIYIASRDSMLNNEVAAKTNLAQYNYDIQKKQAEISVLNKDKQLQQVLVQRQRFLLAGAVAALLLIITSLIILYLSNAKRKKANALLHEQNLEIQAQRDQTGKALNELKLAQKQLIQSEKMASLGELTAGIAHEIQNPLNFVTNFSVISIELFNEMKMELDKGNVTDAKDLLTNAIMNLEKINFHGKRADLIIKGMLQHSRSSSGVKEPTDINSLADEYLRLSYHGLRAKDSSFNVSIKTDYDSSIGKINIISQDIGRVILNLLTNAFYAANEKRQNLAATERVVAYEPTVLLSTKKTGNKISINVKDNGNGIPQKVLAKIFQPFFTTKPAGQGTGLGLSLSYDIIAKNGGQLKVETKENEGSVFTIELPCD
ncbi:MAG: ATP-binding protein [Bacteroidia bacterium]